MTSTLEHDPRVQNSDQRPGLAGLLGEYRRKLARGDVGQLPVIVGLVVIAAVFQYFSDGVFLSRFNLVNLTFQMGAGGSIAVGVVLVLLLGEIDLSAGVVGGLSAAVMAVLNVRYGLSGPAAVAISVLVGMAVGAFQGTWTTRFGIPSFVVTLAGLIGWQGAMLYVLGRTGSINLLNPFIVGLAGTFFHGPMAYCFAALFIAYVAIAPMLRDRRRRAAGLTVPSTAVNLVRAVVITVLVIAVVILLEQDRGVSSGLLFLLGIVVTMDFVLRRTRFGRMIYAVGGNTEAARRAGIPVRRVRALVFMLASMFAAWGGVLGASRLLAVNQSAGQGSVLINAIAAAVIGGTSLFGGRGSVWAALLGYTVIQSISNGMDLLSLDSSIKFMITGGVLLATVTIDAVLRGSGAQAGR